MLDAKIKASHAQIDTLVKATGTHLPDLYGIGPVIAGRILAEVARRGQVPDQETTSPPTTAPPQSMCPRATRSATGSRGLGTGASITPST